MFAGLLNTVDSTDELNSTKEIGVLNKRRVHCWGLSKDLAVRLLLGLTMCVLIYT